MKISRGLNGTEWMLIIIFAFLLLFGIGFPMLVMATETKVGDTKTVNQQTPVYESYQPGSLEKVICTLPSGQKVKIRQILTSNDLPGHEQTAFTEIEALVVEAPDCTGWTLPQYLK
jgi:hypothetical protein